ncbi:MAG: TolB family protein, partial [Kordiimonas sp.]
WFFDVTWTADNKSIVYAPEPSQRKLETLNTETGKASIIFSQSKGLFSYRGVQNKQQMIATERSWDTNIYRVPLGSGINSLYNTKTDALVSSTRSDWQPRVTPNGDILTFLSDRTGEQEIWASDPEGRNARQLSHLNGDLQIHVFDWDSAGELITFDAYDDRIYVLDTTSGTHRVLSPVGMMARNPSFSNDGKSVIFTSDHNGEWQIWRIPTAGGTPDQVTQKGGFSARYNENGDLYVTKYYKDGLWQVDPKTGDETLVIPHMITGPMQQWTLRREGVYYLNNQIGRAQIFFYDWQTQEPELLHDMPHVGFTFELSANGKDILFTRDDSRASDIVLLK